VIEVHFAPELQEKLEHYLDQDEAGSRIEVHLNC
jgi:hypothetical protein